MAKLEEALSAIEARVAEAQKSANRLTKLLRRLAQAARTGNIAELNKGLDQVAQCGDEAAAAARSLGGAWSMDAVGHLGEGYLAELREAAAAAGIHLTEKDGRIFAFPLVLRIAADQIAVRVGRKLERRIRPKVLAAQIAAMQ
jgi:hypothetical protein